MIYLLRLPRALSLCALTIGYLLLCGAALVVTTFYFALTSESPAHLAARLEALKRTREVSGRP